MKNLPPLHIGPPTEAGALSAWRIVEITRQKGEFRVSWRYRDSLLRRRCWKLKRQGWLRKLNTPAGEDIYALSAAARNALAGALRPVGAAECPPVSDIGTAESNGIK